MKTIYITNNTHNHTHTNTMMPTTNTLVHHDQTNTNTIIASKQHILITILIVISILRNNITPNIYSTHNETS